MSAKNNDIIPISYSQKSTHQKTIASGAAGRSHGTLPKLLESHSSQEVIPRYPGGNFPTLGLNKYRDADIAAIPINPFKR